MERDGWTFDAYHVLYRIAIFFYGPLTVQYRLFSALKLILHVQCSYPWARPWALPMLSKEKIITFNEYTKLDIIAFVRIRHNKIKVSLLPKWWNRYLTFIDFLWDELYIWRRWWHRSGYTTKMRKRKRLTNIDQIRFVHKLYRWTSKLQPKHYSNINWLTSIQSWILNTLLWLPAIN